MPQSDINWYIKTGFTGVTGIHLMRRKTLPFYAVKIIIYCIVVALGVRKRVKHVSITVIT